MSYFHHEWFPPPIPGLNGSPFFFFNKLALWFAAAVLEALPAPCLHGEPSAVRLDALLSEELSRLRRTNRCEPVHAKGHRTNRLGTLTGWAMSVHVHQSHGAGPTLLSEGQPKAHWANVACLCHLSTKVRESYRFSVSDAIRVTRCLLSWDELLIRPAK